VAQAVADLGGPGPIQSELPYHDEPQPFVPRVTEARAIETPAPETPEPPKRRSTVREPAPMFSSGAMSDFQPSPVQDASPPVQEAPVVAAPAPTPAPEPEPAPAPEPAAESPAAAAAEPTKRRFGWWSKRG
jgi:hypothetical protein